MTRSQKKPSVDPSPLNPDPFSKSRFMRAVRGLPVDATPVWLMRQAGRYMAEYRKLRAKVPFLSLCRRPDLAAQVTVEAQARIGADAAILFSDLLLILEPMGAGLRYTADDGPKLRRPVRSPADVARLRPARPLETLGTVYDAVRIARRALPRDVPLIGFAGAPFTLASYLIEGGGSRDHLATKGFMHRHPAAWNRLLARLARDAAEHLRGQFEAGCQAIQVFDSWVGCLSPEDYRRSVLPHTRALFARLPAGGPAIHFGTQTAGLLELMRSAGGTVLGIDHRVPIEAARRRLGGMPVMGNLDPAVLLADRATIRRHARAVLRGVEGRPGHVFNLGHGVLPPTPVDNVRFLIDFVHDETAR